MLGRGCKEKIFTVKPFLIDTPPQKTALNKISPENSWLVPVTKSENLNQEYQTYENHKYQVYINYLKYHYRHASFISTW